MTSAAFETAEPDPVACLDRLATSDLGRSDSAGHPAAGGDAPVRLGRGEGAVPHRDIGYTTFSCRVGLPDRHNPMVEQDNAPSTTDPAQSLEHAAGEGSVSGPV